MLRKTIIFLVVLATATAVNAGTGPQNIAVTAHNLSSSGSDFQYAATNEDQICIFCHTPHGGSLDAPLWNRDDTKLSGTFDHYDSVFLSGTLGLSSTRAVNKESLICLSCHDGSLGIGDIINNSGVVPDNDVVLVQPDFFNNLPGPQIGTSQAKLLAFDSTTYDLTDDHPISVSYFDVSTSAEKSAEFQSVAFVEGKNLKLFGGATKTVECATCHDPHVDYTVSGDPNYAPFLAIPNTGSDLCLSCHIK